jgi:Cu/Ag efflux protein CusF
VSDACTTAYGERDTLTKSLKGAGLASKGWPRRGDAKKRATLVAKRFATFTPGDTLKNVVKLLVTALTTCALHAVTFAQAKPVTPATPAAPAMEMKPQNDQATILTGKVTAVDAKAGKLTVKTKDKEIKLTTDSKSTKAALEKLKVGDAARVFEKGGKVIAASPVKTDSKTNAVK